MMHDPITRLRRFNRAVVRETGALDTSFLGRGRPLGAARVLHLVQPDGTDVARIRARLGLDSGLMSRFLRALEQEGLIETRADPEDRRRGIAVLTAKGQAEMVAYHALNNERVDRMLARAGKRADEVLAAMDLIASILNRDQVEILPADPDSSDARACLDAYFTELAARVSGIGPGKFTDPDAEAYRPPRGRMLLAWSDELPIGCVSLRLLDGKTAEVKRLWVAGHARGQGLSRRLMQAIEAEARGMGMTSLKLDTHSALTEAVSLYRASGWRDIPPYTGLPADTWLAKVL